MNKVFKYYAIAPLTYGNIFSTDTNPKLKDFEIIYHGTKYTCDSEDAFILSGKNFFTIDQLKKFIKNDELANKIITLYESNTDKGRLTLNKNLYFKSDQNIDDRKFKLYIDENIETNSIITINGKKLNKNYIIPLETIDYLIQEGLDKEEFDSEDEKKLKYNEELLDNVKSFVFNIPSGSLIKSYQIGTDEEVNIDECLNIEDVEKIYQGIKNNKTIKIKTIEQTDNFYYLNHDFKDKNIYEKWEKLKKTIKINPNFYLEDKDLCSYLQKKLDISGNIEFESKPDDYFPGRYWITIKIPDKYLVDRLTFNFYSKNDKKHIKADIWNKGILKYYDFKINPPYADIAKKLKEDYDLDDSNYTLEYNGKPLKKNQKIIINNFRDIVVYLEDNEKNKEFLTDTKPKEIYFETIGEKFFSKCICLNNLKNNELLKWAQEFLKNIKSTNNISNFDIKFYKDEEAKEEIQIPDDGNNINFEYKEGDYNKIYISISEKEKEKGKRDKEKDKEKNGEGVSEQSTEGNGTKEKKGCCKYK